MAQSCVSLTGSTVCPAFNASSISTDSSLTANFPFLSYVSDTKSFDDRLTQYIATSYTQQKYQQLLGCSSLNLTDANNLYARYTASVICNAIVQNSKTPCSLSNADSEPLCADSCAQQATSEELIIASPEICGSAGSDAMKQIRADFTNCALPADSLTGNCISGADNEPDNCGYANNLSGLCSYCGASSPNATDSCCTNSDVNSRCKGVHLPVTTSMPPLFTSTVTSIATGTQSPTAASAAGHSSGHGLSGGAIAGIVIGSVVGAALLLGLIIFCCLRRKKQGSQQGSIFNQPSPPRRGTQSMVFNPASQNGPPQQGYEVLPGGRIARMSALEEPRHASDPNIEAAALGRGRRQYDNSSSSGYGDSPESQSRYARGPPTAGKRNGSLSSGSVLASGEDFSSPRSGSNGQFSSPDGVTSGQSEQLPFFKDYYSQDEIHPNDKVATLWAYQPRAGDEFELERGDMLKVVGIWDDGWATGVRINERAEDWETNRRPQRDSGVSNGSGGRGSSPVPTGEIKAFPLVCVCLPEHWRKTIEGDGSSPESGSPGGSPRDQ
ncbi:MAG: hypothetical protein M1819_001409 [Sarea resinae]|nr:MAG: hypothetical protein M1819_001409 [Sarea resinae]